MKTRKFLGCAVAVLAAGGIAAWAQRGGPPDMAPGDDTPDMGQGAPGMMAPPGGPDMGSGGPDMMPPPGGPGMEDDDCGMMQPQQGGRGPNAGGRPGIRMQRGGHGPQNAPGPAMDPESLKKAGASDQQLKALEELAVTQQTKEIDLRASGEKAQIAFERLMKADNADETAIMQAVDTINQVRSKSFKSQIALQLKVRSILGADLLKKLQPNGMGRPGRGPRGAATDRHQAPGSDAPPAPQDAKQ
jgi:hypothetical protein